MARPQPFRKQAGGTQESFTSQSNVEAAFGGLAKSIILDGVYIENIPISTTETIVEHKLGRVYRGYIICKNNTFCEIKQLDKNDVSKFITLQATANTTVSLWIF